MYWGYVMATLGLRYTVGRDESNLSNIEFDCLWPHNAKCSVFGVRSSLGLMRDP